MKVPGRRKSRRVERRHRHFGGGGLCLRIGVESLEPRWCLATDFAPLDIEDGSVVDSSYPQNMVSTGELMFFTARDSNSNGANLWRTDGTPAGTIIVKEMTARWTWAELGGLTNVNGTLFFVASDDATGAELWKSDGTVRGTMLVKDISPAGSSIVLHGIGDTLVNAAGTLFFSATDGIHGSELWRSDGTAAGTFLVADVRAGAAGSSPFRLVASQGSVFFSADDGVSGAALWRSDGTAAGTRRIRVFQDEFERLNLRSADVSGTLFMSAFDAVHGSELWTSDGTPEGTRLVADVFPGPDTGLPDNLTNVQGTLFFTARAPASGVELWKSDGTSAGTQIVLDIRPGFLGSYPLFLTEADGRLFFRSHDGIHGGELWRSDGMPGGTTRISNIIPGPEPGNSFQGPTRVTNGNGTLYFWANDGTHGYELWQSNGEPNGEELVLDILPGAPSSQSNVDNRLTSSAGTLYFLANDGASGHELWKSGGTAASTSLVKDLRMGQASSDPGGFTQVGNQVFFSLGISNTGGGGALWTSDGSRRGSRPIETAPGIPVFGRHLSNYGEVLIFDGGTSTQPGLWRTDGTTQGTTRILQVAIGDKWINPHGFVNVNGTMFFGASDGNQLWKSDGTTAGTVLVRMIQAVPSFPLYRQGISVHTAVNNTLFFLANDATHGRELWKSDGTEAGTIMVRDINPGAANSDPRELVNVNGTLFFTAFDYGHGDELWMSDGTEAGTIPVRDIRPGWLNASPQDLTNVGGILYFRASSDASGNELWRSDGSVEGTTLVRDIYPGPRSAFPRLLTNVNGTLYFSARDDVQGYELWRTDGTQLGTHLVKKISPSIVGSTPQSLTNVNGRLFFSANDGAHGHELWSSDGNEAGTLMTREFNPGAGGSHPGPPVSINGRLLVAATNPGLGREPWFSRPLGDANPSPVFDPAEFDQFVAGIATVSDEANRKPGIQSFEEKIRSPILFALPSESDRGQVRSEFPQRRVVESPYFPEAYDAVWPTTILGGRPGSVLRRGEWSFRSGPGRDPRFSVRSPDGYSVGDH